MYMEDMEVSKDTDAEFDKARNPEEESLYVGKYAKGVLGHIKESDSRNIHTKQTTARKRIPIIGIVL